MNVDTLRLLVAKGLSPEDILEIAETLDAPKPRSPAAVRQARYRARQKGEGDNCDAETSDVTSDVTRYATSDVTSDVTSPLSLPPNENNSNPPTHTHPDITSRVSARAKADPFPRPDWADPVVWSDFLLNRKRKSLPNTATAHAKLLRDIEALTDADWPPGRLLEAITARGWAAAYDPRETENDRSPQRNNRQARGAGSGQDRRSSLARAIDEGLEFLGGP